MLHRKVLYYKERCMDCHHYQRLNEAGPFQCVFGLEPVIVRERMNPETNKLEPLVPAQVECGWFLDMPGEDAPAMRNALESLKTAQAKAEAEAQKQPRTRDN